jgi:L-ascorbate metabolism protein UlaG (beta-lactamase superfamily)
MLTGYTVGTWEGITVHRVTDWLLQGYNRLDSLHPIAHGSGMNCTYLGHSAFLVEGEELLLLFDHTAGPFALPATEKALVVFASHRHSDHYDPSIFEFASHPAGAHFVLSSDIPASDVPDGLDVHWMGPHEQHEVAGVGIETLRSTDEGVAFVLEVGGKRLYYGGDLNHWHWEGESEAYNSAMARAYRAELDRLPAHLDIAFVPVDPRLGEAYSLGAKDLLERVAVDVLVPMHFWGDGSVCSRLRGELGEWDGEVVALDTSPYTWRIA